MFSMIAFCARVFAAFLVLAVAASTPALAQPDDRSGPVVSGDGDRGMSTSAMAFPGDSWEAAPDALTAAWDAGELDAIREVADREGSLAYMIIHRGYVIDEYGAVEREEIVQSVRKSLLSALYGPAVAAGEIDPDATLADLGIDDRDGLTDDEKQATVRNLLTARSGVYHPAAASTAYMRATTPARGAHAPGEFFLYNNWDFNALGTIYNEQTGRDLYEDFDARIAEPIGMQDFDASDGRYFREPISDHPAYHFFMSARDMARFGLLMLRGGSWNGDRILSEEWVEESTRTLSTSGQGGYGYMWWTNIPNVPTEMHSFAARGGGGHFILVIPDLDIVFVHQVRMDGPHDANWDDVVRMIGHLMEAAPGAAFGD